MVTRSPAKRPMCPSCSKPARICLCTRMKTSILDNPIAVTILQHSLEKSHPLNSARIATIGLKNLNLAWVSDVHFDAHFDIYWPLSNPEVGLDDGLSRIRNGASFNSTEPAISFTIEKSGKVTSLNHIWKPLTPSEKLSFNELLASQVAIDNLKNGFIVKKSQKGKLDESGEYELREEFVVAIPSGSVLLFPSETSVGVEEINFEVRNLIVLDGTWSKAKRIYKENPWLKFLPHLKLDIDKLSLYSEVRRQPGAGCLSSIESIVYALKAVGEDLDGLDGLLDVFESMIGDQRRCMNERTTESASKVILELSMNHNEQEHSGLMAAEIPELDLEAWISRLERIVAALNVV